MGAVLIFEKTTRGVFMIVTIKNNVETSQIDNLLEWIKSLGLSTHVSRGDTDMIIGLIGDTTKLDIDLLRSLDIVDSVTRIQETYKNANRKFHPENTVVNVDGHTFGNENFPIIAGPCSVESYEQVLETAKAKFDETVELHVRLGVDPKQADQQVRGVIVLPNGTGKNVKVLVLAKGEKADQAKEAGADFVGAEEMIQKIQAENWFDYDVIITTPDMMGLVGRIGKILGPKGLMPNPKSGTVTMDVAKAIKDTKAGKVEYRLDKNAIIHCAIGKKSFGVEKLKENYDALMEAIVKAKPAAAKGQYVKSVALASTMGPGVKINAKI